MSISDAIARVSAIESQLAALRSGGSPAAAAGTAVSTAAPAGSAAQPSSFASALAQAQSTAVAAPVATGPAAGSPVLSSGGVATMPPSGGVGLGPAGSVALTPTAQSLLTSSQQQFASRLAADTGLSPQVISAWLLAEENGGAAQSRQGQNNNDWLNIGYTDAGTYGSSDSVWSDPTTAADATAGWLQGRDTIPGYGTASSGIRAILATAGQAPEAQIAAIQQSGWASSGYPDLPGVYARIAG